MTRSHGSRSREARRRPRNCSAMRKAAGSLACSFALSVAMLWHFSGEASAQTISAQGLQADIAILRRAFEELHPGLYRYNTKAQMDAAFATLASTLGHDRSLDQTYLAFSQFAAKIQSGETYANPSSQPEAVAKALFQGQNRVPYFFEWIDGDMVVTRDFTHDGALPRGTRIAILNDVPTHDILARLLTVTVATARTMPRGSPCSGFVARRGMRRSTSSGPCCFRHHLQRPRHRRASSFFHRTARRGTA